MNWSGNWAFATPAALWLLAALPLLALWRTRRGAAAALVFSSTVPFATLGQPRRAAHRGFWLGVLLLGLAVLIVALARPQLINVSSQIRASGIDIMLALDVSPSMLAEDVTIGEESANRLEAVKKVSQDFIASRKSDRIGMVAFSGRPYLVSPLTLDHDWLLKNLTRVRVGLVEDGTAIGLAVASCANRLKERQESKSKIIVLLTDGANNAGQISPMTAAEAAHALGIKIYTVGIGSNGRAPIPVGHDSFGRKMVQWIDADVDVPLLQNMAKLGQGVFYRATDGEALQHIFEQIDKLEKTVVETSETKERLDLFPWFLAAGAALVVLHACFGEALSRRLP